MPKKTVLLFGALGLAGMVASFLAGMLMFRPEAPERARSTRAPLVEAPERALSAALSAGIVAPGELTADDEEVDPTASPLGERSLTLALEEAGKLPPLTARTADIQRTETLVAAWDETEDRGLRTAILDELRVRRVPVAREFAEEMVRSPEPADRFIGAMQLRTLGDPAAAEALSEALAQETDPTAELVEAYALSRLDDPSLDPATRERVEDVVPEEWRQQDEIERGGLFDLAVLDGTPLEELKPEFAWFTGELSRAALVQSEIDAAAAENTEETP